MADPPADAQPLRTPPQRLPLQQTTERIAVALRVGNVVVGVPTALLAAVPPVSVRWVVGGLVVLAAWTVVFSLLAMTRGLVAPLMLVDAAVAVGFCLFIGRFVPVGRIDEGSSWIAVIGSICIVSLPFAFSARVAIPVGTLVVVAYAAGFPLAGQPGRGLVHSVVLLTQLVISVGVMAILRRASMAAETALAGETSARGAAAVAAARRADESAQLRLLHDTALTTLTLVGTGAVGRSRALTERAGADLAAIERIPESDRTGPHARVRLDEVLGELMRHPPAGLRLVHTLAPCTAPGHVADALAGAVGEALQNVARHADVDTATMRLTEVDGHVVVEVQDEAMGSIRLVRPLTATASGSRSSAALPRSAVTPGSTRLPARERSGRSNGGGPALTTPLTAIPVARYTATPRSGQSPSPGAGTWSTTSRDS